MGLEILIKRNLYCTIINTSNLSPSSKDQMVLLSRTPIKDSNNEIIGAVGYLRFFKRCREEYHMMNDLYNKMQSSSPEVFQAAIEKTQSALGNTTNNEISQVELLTLQLQYYREELRRLQEKKYPDIVGQTPAFIKVKELAIRMAQTAFSVLITGESGTGKEVFARLIHASSDRADKPLVAINCAAIPGDLLESELFGYTRGAFTGANREGKAGKIAIANGGTIFLDEIGDMPLSLQAKLLRVLEQNEIEPLGATKPLKVDVRFISATRKDLGQMMAEGTFREDLFFRINELRLHLPPLRDRTEDIPLLAEYILQQINNKYGTHISMTEAVLDSMKAYSWPGNIRELNNVIKGAYCMAVNGKIDLPNLPRHITERLWDTLSQSSVLSLQGQRNLMERQLLIDSLEKYDNNLNLIAKKLGISRSTLYKKLAKYHLSPRG